MRLFRKKTESRQPRYRFWLAVLSGIMLGCSFPPSPFGVLACFGLVPLLVVLADLEGMALSLRYTYVAMLVFHLLTLNWTGGYVHANDTYMMIAGAATMLLHPFFYFIPLFIYVFVKRHLGEKTALIALPFIWVAYEFTHSLSEWSFPWLTIGNSQTYDLARIQFISVSGVYGLSFWILIINILAYVLYSVLARKKPGEAWTRSALWLGALLLVYMAPAIYGWQVLSESTPTGEGVAADPEKTITVGIIQSNVDPWEKWTRNGNVTIALYEKLTESLVDRAGVRKPDLVLWPETAVPYDLLDPANWAVLAEMRSELTRLGISVLTGLPHLVYYSDTTRAHRGARRSARTGQQYDGFNSAALIQHGVEEVQWHAKMKMVPFAERIPYAEAFSSFRFLQWSVGVGGWQVGDDTTVFVERKTGARFSSMICYESVYPAFVAAFVKQGAEFIAIITIDSWWGKMSGAYQHQQFAILRAVENRRWIARCAVGGISCFIDPFGHVYDKTELFTQTELSRTIARSNDLTFYTEHGDWLGKGCLFAAGLFLAAAAGLRFKNKTREKQWERQ